jgi:hypothetical protein
MSSSYGGLKYRWARSRKVERMLALLLWLLLFVLCWPLALAALLLYPLVWLLLVPFRVAGIAVNGVLALLAALLFLPARVLGGRPRAARA